MEIAIAVVLFVVGAMMGSFACCQAWRIKTQDKSKWSHCMECGKRIKWWDNLPVVSWLVLRGKCRKCGKKIGVMEILSEVAMGAVFMLVYLFWFVPEMAEGGSWQAVGMLVVLLVMSTGMGILFIYDLRWQQLPQAVLTFCVICATIFASLKIWWLLDVGKFSWGNMGSMVGALAILPGLYLVLYRVSREKWVGSGDYILALAIALVLGEWWLAFVCVFVANFLGSIVGLAGKKKRLAFGPFLIVGLLVVLLAQDFLMKLI